MNARFDTRRRALRMDLHMRRIFDGDTSAERLMADAFILDEMLQKEFGLLDRESAWCYNTGGGEKVASAQAEQFRAVGTYLGLGGVAK